MEVFEYEADPVFGRSDPNHLGQLMEELEARLPSLSVRGGPFGRRPPEHMLDIAPACLALPGLQNINPGLIGGSDPAHVTTAPPDSKTGFRDAGRELLRQTSLAEPGLAGQTHHTDLTSNRGRQGARQGVHLGLPTHEGRVIGAYPGERLPRADASRKSFAKRWGRRFGLELGHTVADTPHGLYVGPSWPGPAELPAQVTDMDRHHSQVTDLVPPYLLQQLLPAPDPAWTARQMAQQIELQGRENERSTSDNGSVAREIEREISNNQDGDVTEFGQACCEKSLDPAGQGTPPSFGSSLSDPSRVSMGRPCSSARLLTLSEMGCPRKGPCATTRSKGDRSMARAAAGRSPAQVTA